MNFVRKAKLEIACDEHVTDKIVEAIERTAKSGDGKVGDGKIFDLEMKDIVRIRTGERGSTAI